MDLWHQFPLCNPLTKCATICDPKRPMFFVCAERAVGPIAMRTLVFCGRTLAVRVVPAGDGHAVRITSGGGPTGFC